MTKLEQIPNTPSFPNHVSPNSLKSQFFFGGHRFPHDRLEFQLLSLSPSWVVTEELLLNLIAIFIQEKMGDEKVKNEALEIMGLFQVLPRLVVFDLDYTLWPFYCECRSKREMPSMYPHAKGILYALKDKGVDMAIASRSPTTDIAETFINKLGIKTMFLAQEIFSSWSHKTEHFKKIQQKTRVPYESMLFFDDEDRNIQAVSKMGVTSILVNNGVTLGAFRQGLAQFSQHPTSSSNKDGKK